MYLAHFNLNDPPFAITPDPHFVFLTPRHREALAHLLYGLREGGGFVQLTGEVGTGKTTICRTLLRQLPDNVDVALIFNPQLTVTELLRGVCEELHMEVPAGEQSAKALTDRLYAYLIDANTRGRRTVLIIDEAQNLTPELLEAVRLLTNLETDDCKLLQIFLIGQPELRVRLAGDDLRQLAQRVTSRYHLEALTQEESALYVRHRLSVAGAQGEFFTAPALRLIHRLSAGIPRRINILCDRALLGSYASGTHRIGPSIVRRAQAELDGKHDAPVRQVRPALVMIALVVVAGAVGLRQEETRAWLDQALALYASAPAVVTAAGPVQPAAGRATAPAASTPDPPLERTASVETPPPSEPVTPVADETAAQPAAPLPSPPAPAESVAPTASMPSAALADRIAAMDGDGRRQAVSAMARAWGEAEPPTDSDLCDWAPQRGLACYDNPGGWPQLRALDLPAILKLDGHAGEPAYALLRGLTGETAIIELAGQVHRLSQQEINRLWSGESVLLWRPPLEDPRLLHPGQRRPVVAWLRQQLARLDGDEPSPTAGEYYDDVLRDRVFAFQRRYGLYVDGIVGPQTLIFLSQDMIGAGIPRLDERTESDMPAAPVPALAAGDS